MLAEYVGFTEQEVELCGRYQMDREIKNWYDGYSFRRKFGFTAAFGCQCHAIRKIGSTGIRQTLEALQWYVDLNLRPAGWYCRWWQEKDSGEHGQFTNDMTTFGQRGWCADTADSSWISWLWEQVMFYSECRGTVRICQCGNRFPMGRYFKGTEKSADLLQAVGKQKHR